MIVIFNANMFGLSTLHQLRGRVGRGDTQSYCVLVAKESEERLRFLETLVMALKLVNMISKQEVKAIYSVQDKVEN